MVLELLTAHSGLGHEALLTRCKDCHAIFVFRIGRGTGIYGDGGGLGGELDLVLSEVIEGLLVFKKDDLLGGLISPSNKGTTTRCILRASRRQGTVPCSPVTT